jgi:hypothetical protein
MLVCLLRPALLSKAKTTTGEKRIARRRNSWEFREFLDQQTWPKTFAGLQVILRGRPD